MIDAAMNLRAGLFSLGVSVAAAVWLVALGDAPGTIARAQGQKNAAVAERGQYLVEGVALCGRCHTPVDATGRPDRSRWLVGAPIQTRPSGADPAWAVSAPRLAGSPPGTDDQFITLLTTGIARNGKPPRPPMPMFHMSRADAEAVLAYLKGLGSGRSPGVDAGSAAEAPIYTAVGAGHLLQRVSENGRYVTLEDSSVWEIDPRVRFDVAEWEPLANMAVRRANGEEGFAYELLNTDEDAGALAHLVKP